MYRLLIYLCKKFPRNKSSKKSSHYMVVTWITWLENSENLFAAIFAILHKTGRFPLASVKTSEDLLLNDLKL